MLSLSFQLMSDLVLQDGNCCVCIFHPRLKDGIWQLIGKYRSHTNLITDITFLSNLENPRLFSVSKDKKIVEYAIYLTRLVCCNCTAEWYRNTKACKLIILLCLVQGIVRNRGYFVLPCFLVMSIDYKAAQTKAKCGAWVRPPRDLLLWHVGPSPTNTISDMKNNIWNIVLEASIAFLFAQGA